MVTKKNNHPYLQSCTDHFPCLCGTNMSALNIKCSQKYLLAYFAHLTSCSYLLGPWRQCQRSPDLSQIILLHYSQIWMELHLNIGSAAGFWLIVGDELEPQCMTSRDTRKKLCLQLFLDTQLPDCLLPLTHWGRVTHICVSELPIIGSDNGLSPGRRQTIIWTNAGILLIGPLGTNFSEILIVIQTFSLKKIRLKMSSAKCCSFRLGLNVLTATESAHTVGPV